MKSRNVDLWLPRLIVLSLAVTLLICTGGSVVLELSDHTIPHLIWGLGTGSLAGLVQIARS